MEEELEVVSAPLLTVGEAARYLGVGRRVAMQLIEHGELRVVKGGRATLVEKAELDRFKASGHLT